MANYSGQGVAVGVPAPVPVLEPVPVPVLEPVPVPVAPLMPLAAEVIWLRNCCTNCCMAC